MKIYVVTETKEIDGEVETYTETCLTAKKANKILKEWLDEEMDFSSEDELKKRAKITRTDTSWTVRWRSGPVTSAEIREQDIEDKE